jgi:hypothetical protein
MSEQLKQRSIGLTGENQRLLDGVRRQHAYLSNDTQAIRYIMAKFALTAEGKRSLGNILEPEQDAEG